MKEKRNINTGSGNYNEKIQGNYNSNQTDQNIRTSASGNSNVGINTGSGTQVVAQGSSTVGINTGSGTQTINVTGFQSGDDQSQDKTQQLIESLRQLLSPTA